MGGWIAYRSMGKFALQTSKPVPLYLQYSIIPVVNTMCVCLVTLSEDDILRENLSILLIIWEMESK